MRIAALVITAVLSLTVLAGVKYSRAGYESADYQVLKKSGPFEIREYSALVLASTPMNGGFEGGDGFMRLFRYISGQNQAEQEIAMTTPVFMTVEGAQRQMSFVVPRDVAEAGAPAANTAEISIEDRKGGNFAAYRFSGGLDLQRFYDAREKLAAWIREEGLQPIGDYIAAGYDPPFTPSFLRRNEVMVRVETE